MKNVLYSYLLMCVILLHANLLWADTSETDSLTLELARTTEVVQKIKLLNKLASISLEKDVGRGLDYAEEMVTLIKSQPQGGDVGAYYADAAILYLNGNVYDKALELLFKALGIIEKGKNRGQAAIIKNTMGGVYLRLNKMQPAMRYFKEGLEECQKMINDGDSTYYNALHIFYNNIGLIYNLEKDKKILAGNYLEKAIEFTDPSDKYNLGQYYNNIASCYYESGKKSRAFECAFKSLEYREEINDEKGLANTCYTIASLYFYENNLKESKKYLIRVMDIGTKIKSNLILKNAYNLTIDIALLEKDFEHAYDYSQKVREIEYVLINDTILARTTTMKMEYDFAKKTAIQELETQKSKVRFKLLLYGMIMVLVTMILLYFLIRSRARRIQLEKINLERDLEVRNKELTTNVMYLMRNTDMLREVSERLIKIGPNLKSENQKVIKDSIIDLQSMMKNDLWQEFEAHFNRVHLDFYKKLKDRCQELTPTEFKICAFLRLNMSSKEISSITGITVRSVEVARSKIRKKLDITNTEVNLITFLSDF